MAAPTITDLIMLKLGLDPSELEKGAKQAEGAVKQTREGYEKHGKEFINTSQLLTRTLSQLQYAFEGLIAALGVRELDELIKKTVDLDNSIGNLAASLDMPVEELSKWDIYASTFKMRAGEIGGAFKYMQQSWIEFTKKSDLPEWAFYAFNPEKDRHGLGLKKEDFLDAKGNIDAAKTLLAISDKLKDKSPEEQLFYVRRLGFKDEDAARRMIALGSTGIEAGLEKVKNWGVTTKADVAVANELTEAFAHLSAAIYRLGEDIRNDLTGPLTEFSDWAIKFFDIAHKAELEHTNLIGKLVEPASSATREWLKSMGVPLPEPGALSGAVPYSPLNPTPAPPTQVDPRTGAAVPGRWLVPGATPPAAQAKPEAPASPGAPSVPQASPVAPSEPQAAPGAAPTPESAPTPAPAAPRATPATPTPPTVAPSGINYTPVPPEALGQSSPTHIGGELDIEGTKYPFGSGGAGYSSIPYGDYPITPGTIGPWGQAHGALGINNNEIWDARLKRYREGIELHSGSSDELITEGCVAIAGAQWQQAKAQVLAMIKKYGTAYLHVGPNGAASITPTKALATPVPKGAGATSTPVPSALPAPGTDAAKQFMNSLKPQSAISPDLINLPKSASLTSGRSLVTNNTNSNTSIGAISINTQTGVDVTQAPADSSAALNIASQAIPANYSLV